MQLLKVIVLIAFSFLPPQLLVNWAGGKHDGVRILMSGSDEITDQCVRGGLEARFRFELRFCKKRSIWLDKCAEVRMAINSLQYDPISEIYSVTSDIIGDEDSPKVSRFNSVEEAIKQATVVEFISLDFLDPEGLRNSEDRRSYVKARILTECRGEYSETFLRLSYLLSLGLIRTSGFDSGWIGFGLDQ